MCGRFAAGQNTQTEMLDIIRGFLDTPAQIDTQAPVPHPSWNVKPTQMVSMLYQSDTVQLSSGRWWFVPDWHRGDVKDFKLTTFNAKIETAHEKPTFRKAWKTGRCIIPAQGYFEWTGPKHKRQPWFVSVQSNQPSLFFAGLWSRLDNGLNTCTILTRAASPQIKALHPRMPVIADPTDIAAWLTGDMDTQDAIDTLGTGWDERFTFHPVARFGRDDDGECVIEPIGLL